jgi:hypothetical protein
MGGRIGKSITAADGRGGGSIIGGGYTKRKEKETGRRP